MKPPQRHPFKVAYESTVKCILALSDANAKKVVRLRGNIQKRALLIAPSPNEDDCVNGIPLSNETYAREFHGMVSSLAELNTQDDFVVMAGCPLADAKPTKKIIEPFRDLLLEQRRCFDLVVCIGSNNFKFYFGRGKKSSLQTLAAGKPVFMTFDWPDLPVFIIPDIHAISPKWTNDRNFDWKLEIAQQQCQRWLERILPGLGKAYRTYVKS
jgi:hypothetical protein